MFKLFLDNIRVVSILIKMTMIKNFCKVYKNLYDYAVLVSLNTGKKINYEISKLFKVKTFEFLNTAVKSV